MDQHTDDNHAAEDLALIPDTGAARPGSFDYGGLESKTVATLRSQADDIRRLTTQTTKRLLVIGDMLILAKPLVGHGRFGAWLEAEFGWTERSAQRFMRAAEAFGAKSDTVSVLEPTAVYALSAPSTPRAVRDAVVKRLECGERPPLTTIKAEVADARKVARIERQAKRESRYGVPAVPAGTVRARAAAQFLLDQLGERSDKLSALLTGVDAAVLLAALRDPGSLRPSPPAVLTEL